MKATIYFDGSCNLCSRSVQFILPRDRQGHFRFASLQGEAGQRMLKDAPSLQAIDSIILVCEDGRQYVQSDAVLRIGRRLPGVWSIGSSLCLLVPRPLRDRLYRYVAARRYRWFGRSDHCLLPDPAWRDRFID